jgi:hypothetical protein
MHRALLIAATATLVACAGNPARTGVPAPEPGRRLPPAPSAISLRDHWDARVVVEREDSIILTLPSGDKQLQRFTRRGNFTLAVDDGGRYTLRLDSLVVRPRSTGETAPLGAMWKGQVTDARVGATQVTEGGDAAATLTAMVRNLLPRLPADGFRAGARWADTSEGKVRVDIFSGSERRTAEWTVGSLGDHDGVESMPVRVRETFEQLGDGNQGGRKITMTAQGRRQATYYLTTEGRISHAALEDSVAMLISIPATRQVVPTIRYGRTTVRFLPLARGRAG